MMEEMYGFSSSGSDHHQHHHHYPNHFPVIPQPEDYAFAAEAAAAAAFPSSAVVASDTASMVVPEARRCGGGGGAVTAEEEISAVIRARIASHPLYPKLLQAYIDCQKVGAPPEVAGLLEDIQRDNNLCSRAAVSSSSSLGADPELDDFMEAYCDVLAKYRSDLSRPFDEATTFLNNIESQLNNLCASRTHISDEAVGSSEEEFSGGEVEVQDCSRIGEDRELKDKLLRKYSGYISTLKLEFSKKKKKGKLPKEARQTLLDWWNVHYKWPYPTEADKVALAEVTGLDQKQINNWFINQRKRHWKPSENMQFAVMDSVYGQPYFSNN